MGDPAKATRVRMTLLDHALTSCLAAALLAGCSGSQPPIGATAQGGTAQAMAHASSGSYSSLLYVGGRFETMYSYPRMKALGTLTPEAGFGQGCPDAVTGNIYFPANISGPIVLLQFPYGATSASARLLPPDGYDVTACSADPSSGNLAVTINKNGGGTGGYIAIYSPGSSQPQTYSDPDLLGYGFCTYDNEGDLFFLSAIKPDEQVLAELLGTSGSFEVFSLNLNALVTSLQWDGRYVTAESRGRRHGTPSEIYRLAVVGSTATIVSTTKLKGAFGGIWIQGSTALSGRFGNAKGRSERYMAYYRYPKGGKPYAMFEKLPPAPIHNFAILSAPTGSRGW